MLGKVEWVSFDEVGKLFALDTHQVSETLHVPRIVDPGVLVKVGVWWFQDGGEKVPTTIWIVLSEWKCHCSVSYVGSLRGLEAPCQGLRGKDSLQPSQPARRASHGSLRQAHCILHALQVLANWRVCRHHQWYDQ